MRKGLENAFLKNDLNGAGRRLHTVKQVKFMRQTVVYASQAAGVALNASLSGESGTDDTAALQTILNTAPALSGGLKLIMDAPALVSGLDVYSNTEIECLPGAGFFLKTGSNRPIIRNKNPSRTTRTDKYIKLIGGVYNGNQAGQIHHTEDGTWVVPIGLYGVEDVVIHDITLLNPRTFGIHIGQWRNVRITDCRQDLPRPGTTPESLNQDFIHFNGPGRQAYLSNISGGSWDDFIAFNADDGIGINSETNELGPWIGEGDITDVTIDGVRMNESLFGIRLLSKTSRIDRVTIRDVKGTTRGHYLLLDTFPDGSAYNAAQTGNFGKITIEDVDVQPHDQIFTDLAIQIGGRFDQLIVRNLRKTNLNIVNPNYGFIVINTLADVGQLTIDGLMIRDTGQLNRQGTAEIIVQGKVARMQINNVDWLRDEEVNYNGTLVAVKDASSDVGCLTLNDVSVNHIINLLAVLAGGTLRKIRAINVTVDDVGPDGGLLYTVAGLPVAPELFTTGYSGPKLLSGPGDFQPVCSSADTDRLIILTDIVTGTFTTPTATGVMGRATVTRTGPGAFHVEFGEYVARYTTNIIASNDNTSQKLASLAGNLSAVTTGGFYFAISDVNGDPVDAAVIMVSLNR